MDIVEQLRLYGQDGVKDEQGAMLQAASILVHYKARIERLEAALKENNHHLAKLVNGTDEDDPVTWEGAKNQVLAARAVLARKEG